MLDRDKILWYPLRVSHSSASRLLKLQELLREEELIEQTYVPMEYRTKDFKTQLVPVISNLIFVRATYNQLNVVRHSTNLYAPLRYMMRPVTEGSSATARFFPCPTR